MSEIIQRTTWGALLLLVVPVLVWISGWQWTADSMGLWAKALFWVTETVTRPWGIITTILFCGWFLWCLRFRLKSGAILLIIIFSAITAGQFAKSTIKASVQEPRPYVLWLAQHYGLDEKTFYSLKRTQRSNMVQQLVGHNTTIPGWLKSHWQFETGFAFPSGHTLFAATWALLAVGVLWPRRHIKTILCLILWAEAVMISRMVLGMHWPQDLIAAIVISWVIVTIATLISDKYCGSLSISGQEKREIQQRE